MRRDTLIKHKEVVVVCAENGDVNMSYNVILTTLEVNARIKLVVPIVTAKSTLTCTNCGKTNRSMETYHNKKGEVQVVPIAIVKSMKLVA
jgi:hypothetical protein